AQGQAILFLSMVGEVPWWIRRFRRPAVPWTGGPFFFNSLGIGKDDKSLKELKLKKEIKNGRLAMLADTSSKVWSLVL
ncbi:hypothetical protein Dimus_019935, partial [Dionaea muscipula]